MDFFLTSLAAVVVVLGVMILVHEWGHYAVAKLCGVRVEVFSIGFGKRLFGFRSGETDYRLSALPFGGYVKMSGENPMEPSTGDPGEFMSHPRWQRLLIAIAGPAMNVILAIVVLTGVYMVRYEQPAYLNQPADIGWVVKDSPAAKAGLQPGDRIVRIENVQNPTWEQVQFKEVLSPEQPLDVAVKRDGRIFDVKVVPRPTGEQEFGTAGWMPEHEINVTGLPHNMPAAKAGIQLGDVIVALDGNKVRSLAGMISYLQAQNGKPVELTVLRNRRPMQFTVTPAVAQQGDQKRYVVGIESNPVEVKRLPFAVAVSKSLETNRKFAFLIVELVGKMIQGKVSMRQVEGPIGIMRVSGEAAQQEGWTPLLQLMAAISLNLGIFNLFPIPILDGGVILLLLIEGALRRDISVRVKERIYQASFVFLVLFAAMVIYNDIAKLVS